jgi:hypothetical protein
VIAGELKTAGDPSGSLIDIILIDLTIEISSDHIEMIDVAAMFSDQRDVIPKSGERSKQGNRFLRNPFVRSV